MRGKQEAIIHSPILGWILGYEEERHMRILAENVTKSSYLMGNKTGSKISLWSIITEELLLKTKEGDFHSAEEWDSILSEKKSEEITKTLKQEEATNPKWHKVLKVLKDSFGNPTYISWFSKLTYDSVEKGTLSLKAPTSFVAEYIDVQYGRKILQLASKYFGEIDDVKIDIQEQKKLSTFEVFSASKNSKYGGSWKSQLTRDTKIKNAVYRTKLHFPF